MNAFRIFFLSVLILPLTVACSSRQTAATLDDIESYIQTRPDSALASLRAIDTTSLKTRRLQAHYALLQAIALDKNWIDTTDVGVIMPAVSYYKSSSHFTISAESNRIMQIPCLLSYPIPWPRKPP